MFYFAVGAHAAGVQILVLSTACISDGVFILLLQLTCLKKFNNGYSYCILTESEGSLRHIPWPTNTFQQYSKNSGKQACNFRDKLPSIATLRRWASAAYKLFSLITPKEPKRSSKKFRRLFFDGFVQQKILLAHTHCRHHSCTRQCASVHVFDHRCFGGDVHTSVYCLQVLNSLPIKLVLQKLLACSINWNFAIMQSVHRLISLVLEIS